MSSIHISVLLNKGRCLHANSLHTYDLSLEYVFKNMSLGLDHESKNMLAALCGYADTGIGLHNV